MLRRVPLRLLHRLVAGHPGKLGVHRPCPGLLQLRLRLGEGLLPPCRISGSRALSRARSPWARFSSSRSGRERNRACSCRRASLLRLRLGQFGPGLTELPVQLPAGQRLMDLQLRRQLLPPACQTSPLRRQEVHLAVDLLRLPADGGGLCQRLLQLGDAPPRSGSPDGG